MQCMENKIKGQRSQKSQMKLRILLRPSLTIVFGFIGAFIARNVTPPEVFAITGNYFLLVAILAFGVLGFILPELLELAGRAGIAVLARQIVSRLPRRRKNIGKKLAKYQNPLICDTSALIDGRIGEIVKTGFVFGTFLVIPSVISELHRLADSADELKRGRGRRGLDILEVLKRDKTVKLEVLKTEPKERAVDDKLIKAAKQVGGKIVTVDYNLNKVAKVKGILALNINELANAVKTAVLPGERLKIQIKSVGREEDQGVGYLDDGTMVVVEQGAKLKGRSVDVEVLRVLQTAAGKMIFGKVC